MVAVSAGPRGEPFVLETLQVQILHLFAYCNPGFPSFNIEQPPKKKKLPPGKREIRILENMGAMQARKIHRLGLDLFIDLERGVTV